MPAVHRQEIKRQTDQQLLMEWIEPRSTVLDLGCGRGVLLAELRRQRNVNGVGIDSDLRRILSCVKRGVPAYQGDIRAIMDQFPDNSFDWVICSRTIQQLTNAGPAILDMTRVGKRVAMGFVNYGYWKNRLYLVQHGSRTVNEVFPNPWWRSRPENLVSLNAFEEFCQAEGIQLHRQHYLRGDWKTPCPFYPKLFAGYALFEISRGN